MGANNIFFTNKTNLIESLKKMNARCCVYSIHDKLAELCDCKYGASNFMLNNCGEKTGCPELRSITKIFEVMTDEEYSQFIFRIRNL